MKTKIKIKQIIDILLMLGLLFLMGYQFWGEALHEYVGAGMFLLFLLHHILNIRWYAALLRGKYTKLRVLQTVIDFTLLLDMLALMYSGIIMSHRVFTFLPKIGGMALARKLHLIASYWGFLLMSLHMGLHWNMVVSVMLKRMKKVSGKLLFVMGMVISVYGIWVFIKRDFPTYLFLKSEFVFLNYEELPFLFYVDYLSVMGLCIFAAHLLGQILKKR